MPVHVRRRLTKWGNGFGLRITVAEAKRLGLHAGQDIEANLSAPARTDLSGLPSWDLGGGIGDLDEEVALATEEDLRGDNRGRR